MTAFEAQVIPLDRAAQGASWVSTMSTIGGVMGPAAGWPGRGLRGHPGHVPAHRLGPGAVTAGDPPGRPQAGAGAGGGRETCESLASGVRYVVQAPAAAGLRWPSTSSLSSSVASRLAARLRRDILGVGPFGLGLMRTAPSLGALLAMLVTTRLPPHAHAGPLLLGSVAGFGIPSRLRPVHQLPAVDAGPVRAGLPPTP